MKFWLTVAAFVLSSATLIAVQAWYGLPYSPVGSSSAPGQPYEVGGEVTGQVTLQGRDISIGALITVFQGGIATGSAPVTETDGSFSFDLPPGSYQLRVENSGWLSEVVAFTILESGGVGDVGIIKLLAGDADDNGVVDFKDVKLFQQSLDQSAPEGSITDVDGDGDFGIFDLVHAGLNVGETEDPVPSP